MASLFPRALASALVLVATEAHAQTNDAPVVTSSAERDPRSDVPFVNYTMSPFGAPRGSAGASIGAGVLGHTLDKDTNAVGPQALGMGRAWGAPSSWLTLMLVVDPKEQLRGVAPSATGIVRFAGSREKGYAFAGSLTYKADGFDDLGGELEGGFLLGAIAGPLHLDTNLIFGGNPDEGEADGEFRARIGADLGDLVRVGVDGRFRVRLAGTVNLPGNRLGDLVVGPDVVIGKGRFFFDAFGGPSTVGVPDRVGWTTTGTLGVLVL